jgi:multidrug resistance efflux pump
MPPSEPLVIADAARPLLAGNARVAAALSALAARLAGARGRGEAMQAFADETVRLAGCDAAALALGPRRRVTAVAGAARFDRAGAMADAVGAALRQIEEGPSPAAVHSIESGSPTVCEVARQWDCRSVRAWVLPGARPAALLLGFRGDVPADLDRTLEAAEPAWGSLMAVAGRLGVGGAAGTLLGALFRPLVCVRGWIAILLVGLAAWGLTRPMTHTIRTAARVEAAERRTLSAPADGTLKANHVELGQSVEAGQILGEMDDAETLIRLSDLRAVRERALAQVAAILSGEAPDVARAQLARLDAEAAGIEIEFLNRRLESLKLAAPTSGIVLVESSRLVGARLPLGKPLYEIAPAGAIRLELDVPDNRIAYVREGMELTLSLDSFPGRTWTARVVKIHPQSEAREGDNFFVVEAIPTAAAPEWKPGMRGRSNVRGDPRAAGWVLFHPVWEFFEWLLF